MSLSACTIATHPDANPQAPPTLSPMQYKNQNSSPAARHIQFSPPLVSRQAPTSSHRSSRVQLSHLLLQSSSTNFEAYCLYLMQNRCLKRKVLWPLRLGLSGRVCEKCLLCQPIERPILSRGCEE